MIKSSVRVVPLVGAVVLLASVILASVPDRKLDSGTVMVILCGNRSTMESCGCPGDESKTSVAKEATVIKRLESDYKKRGDQTLVVDVGRNVAKKGLASISELLGNMPVQYSLDLNKFVNAGGWSLKAEGEAEKTFSSEGTSGGLAIDFRPKGELIVGHKKVPLPTENKLIVCTVNAKSGNLVETKTVPIPAETLEDPVLLKLLMKQATAARQQVITDMLQAAKNKRLNTSAAYCGTCHTAAYDSWKKSGHGHALDTLIQKQRVTADCLPCHSTPYINKAGFKEVAGEPEQGVTCVSCHTKSTDHADFPTEPFKETVGKEVCVSCHTPANSPKFDFVAYRKKVHAGVK